MVDADATHAPREPVDRFGRDAYRTPMQWDATPTGGFTNGVPWLPLVDPHRRNVAEQAADGGSLLSLYRRLIEVRRTSGALRRGTHRSIFGVAPDVLAWTREVEGERVLVVLNVGGEARACDLDGVPERSGTVVVATSERQGSLSLDGVVLKPLEGIALRL